MRKKVLFLTSWYPDSKRLFRGIFVKEQAEILSKQVDLVLVAIRVEYERFSPFFDYRIEKEQGNNFPVFRVTVFKSFPVYNQLNFFIAILHFLNKQFSGHSFDLIHCHVSYPAGVVGYYYSKMKKIPYIITEHFGGFTGLFRTPVHKLLLIRALKKADEVTTVSEFSASIMRRYIHRSVKVVPNTIMVEKFPPIVSKDRKTPHLGFLGALHSHVKGLDILLKAIAILKKQEIKLIIGGTGKLMDHYQNQAKELGIAEKCEFLGVIHPEKRSDFYRQLDFFVLPSRHESFGIVLLEAIASGLPVVATRCGGPQEIVEPFTGLLVEPENPEALAAAIEQMAKTYRAYNRAQMRKYVAERFGAAAFTKKMLDLYSKVSGEPSHA